VHPYATLSYAETLAHVGRPLYVPAWQSHVIVRDWKNQTSDATGPYPITCIDIASDLGSGLEQLRSFGLVSITIVVDGLLGPGIKQIERAFTFARPFKPHYLVDYTAGAYNPSKHHRYEIRRAARLGVDVKIVPLRSILPAWTALYRGLVSKRDISGASHFPPESFDALAKCEGLTTVAAFVAGELASCHLWIRYDRFVWSHLAASSPLGYDSGAAYAIYDHSIRMFAGHVVDLGGAAGIGETGNDGLSRVKAGFANRIQHSYLCGAILDPKKYETLCAESNSSGSAYFPAYRDAQSNRPR